MAFDEGSSGFNEFYRFRDVPQEMLSRGSGELVPLNEVTAFDVMPQVIGSAFMADDTLRAGVHFDGTYYGVPIVMQEDIYRDVAKVELEYGGRLPAALDAYRRSLEQAVSWIGYASRVAGPDGGGALFTAAEVDRFNLEERFGALEAQLAQRVWEKEVPFDPDVYTNFTSEVRQLRKHHLQLYQLFSTGRSASSGPLEAAGQLYDPAVGREYIDVCVTMGQFSQAAWAAEKLGLTDEAAQLKARIGEQPKENWRVPRLMEEKYIESEMSKEW